MKNLVTNILSLKDVQRYGHAGKLNFPCSEGHSLKCDTSSHLEGGGGSVTANMKVVHSVYTSGFPKRGFVMALE